MFEGWGDVDDLAKFTKKLSVIQNPDRIPSFSRRAIAPTEQGVKIFLEVQGLGVIVLEAIGSDPETGKVHWQECSIITQEQLLFD